MKMSEYIMECDINTTNVGDIDVAKHYAEMCVSAAIVESYSKYMTICEYATNPSDFNIVMESADTTAEETTKNATESGKKWYQKLIDWAKSTVNNLMIAIDRNNPVNTKKMLMKLKENGATDLSFEFPAYTAELLVEVTNLFDEYAKLISDGVSDKTDYDGIYEAANKLTSTSSEVKGTDFKSGKAGIDGLIEYYSSLIVADIPKTGKNIINNLNKAKGSVRYDDQLVSSIKNASNALMKAYSITYKNFNKAAIEIAREYNKSSKKKPGDKTSLKDKIKDKFGKKD